MNARELIAQARSGLDGSWNDGSRVSLTRRYTLISVAKVACSTLKLAVHRFEEPGRSLDWTDTHAEWPGWKVLDHSDEVAEAALSSSDWFRFCFVRNPFDRLVSAWQSKLRGDGDPAYAWLRKQIAGSSSRDVDFKDAFAFLTGGDQFALRDPHWMPQTKALRPDAIAYDFVGRFENFAADFRVAFEHIGAPPEILALGGVRHNATDELSIAAPYDEELASRVFDFYAEDFSAFGYDRDSWRSLRCD